MKKVIHCFVFLYLLMPIVPVMGQEKDSSESISSTAIVQQEKPFIDPIPMQVLTNEPEEIEVELIINISLMELDTSVSFHPVSKAQHEINIIFNSSKNSVVINSSSEKYVLAVKNNTSEGTPVVVDEASDLWITFQQYQSPILVGGSSLILLIVFWILFSRYHLKKQELKNDEQKEVSSNAIPTGHQFGNATHVGQVRKANEDYYGTLQTRNGELYIVCDGMGGHVGGAKAAQLAVETICTYLDQKDYQDPRQGLYESICAANAAILGYAQQFPEYKGMGATCVVILIKGLNVFYGHVGDSRIYLLSKRRLERLTRDHSYVQKLVDKGVISEEEAEQHPRKNEITRALGIHDKIEPELAINPVPAKIGDNFLLCSDGLTGVVGDARIERVLKKEGTEQEKAHKLIEMANRGGGPDNVTVQIIAFS